jgi:hypothetical protein
MRRLFVAAVAVLVVISIDGWLCLRTLTPGALARSPTFNPLIATAGAQVSPISHYGDYLFVADRAGPV